MSKLGWTPWHRVVGIRDDLKSGELSLAIFAADLYDVAIKRGQRPVYEDPAQFFALTYPTYNLRELAKDVVTRLAGKNEKAVRQLELTYGGGKTHTLITLFHLVEDPDNLPNLPAVEEFKQHIGLTLPKARISAITFDRLDPLTGMDARGPDGKIKRLKMPWSVLAYQLAGEEGLKVLGSADGTEREEPPFTNVLQEVLELPGKENLSTLILIDEVLMWARTKVGAEPVWRHRTQDFFQCLTQAATKVDRCAIVASLLATDPSKSDELGKELTSELYAIFRREREEGVQPVLKEDVAEVLRRRFFTQDSIRDKNAFRPHVVAALKGINDLDEQTRKDGPIAEERFLASYPFHPDLTDVFYTKWTGLEGFQRTRGILRTLALAIRDSEDWDESPLIAANVFLTDPKKAGISEAARELTTVATTETYEGKRQEWTAILEGELAKARDIQSETGSLKFRELEQAVFATFLHSQPIGQRALTRDLMLLLGHTRPDKIELEKASLRWTDVSWFLDEEYIADVEPGKRQLPGMWRLGSKPNLRQMHHDACLRISNELVDATLETEISKTKTLTAGASAAGAKVHLLPQKPSDIDDDGEFHYAVLGSRAASESGKPSKDAARFIDETTASDRPRIFRNAVVLAVPSKDGVEAARGRIKEYLGWVEVNDQLKDHEIDTIRKATLTANTEAAKKRIAESVQHAYSTVVTVSEKDDVQAFKITVENKPLFTLIKDDSRSRIKDTPINAEALLPEGPYNLWREGETSRRVNDLVGAFGQFARLPKMLNRGAIVQTLVDGCVEGRFVLRLVRPDKSIKTFWRESPDETVVKEPGLEVVLPEAAELTDLSSTLLVPGALPVLWDDHNLSAREIFEYFGGGKTVRIKRELYEEPVTIPKASRDVIEQSIRTAVKESRLWLTSGPSSFLGEEIPPGILTDEAVVQGPPQSIAPSELLPENLPSGWSDAAATALTITKALSEKIGKVLPWLTVRKAIDGALSARLVELSIDSGAWPCDYVNADTIKFRIPAKGVEPIPPTPPPPRPGVRVAEADLRPNEIQDLADVMGDLIEAAAGHEMKFKLRIELAGIDSQSEEVVDKINTTLAEVSPDLTLNRY